MLEKCRAAEKCHRCRAREAVQAVKGRLVLGSARAEIDAKRRYPRRALKWISGTDGVTPLCGECLAEEHENLDYLRTLLAAGSIDHGSALISSVISSCPEQPAFFGRLRAKYDPEIISAEVKYAAATCYKLWKLHIARQLYVDSFPKKKDSNNPLANFAVLSFVAIAHAMLDSMACWLRERLSIQTAWNRTGLFPRHTSFRKAVEKRNRKVGKVLSEADCGGYFAVKPFQRCSEGLSAVSWALHLAGG